MGIYSWTTFWAWRTYCGKQRVWRDTRRKLSAQLTDASWVISCRIRAPSLIWCEHSKYVSSGLLTSYVICQESDLFTFLRVMKNIVEERLDTTDHERAVFCWLTKIIWRWMWRRRISNRHRRLTSLRGQCQNNEFTSKHIPFERHDTLTRRLNFFVSWFVFREIGIYTRIRRRR